MATTDNNAEPTTGQAAVSRLLEKYLDMARKGELQSVVVGFIKVDGAAAIQSTPMSAVSMNHLCRLLDRRVSRDYDRALSQAAAQGTGTGAGPVPEQPRQTGQLPRKVRRDVQQRIRNLEKLAAKKAKKSALQTPVIRQSTPQG